MIFVVVNPNNWPDFTMFDTVDAAIQYVTECGYTMVWSREIKISPNARFCYRNNSGNEMLIYCRECNI